MNNNKKSSNTSKETTSKNQAEKHNPTSAYDDVSISEIDTKNVIPDEVPRRDGPGGE